MGKLILALLTLICTLCSAQYSQRFRFISIGVPGPARTRAGDTTSRKIHGSLLSATSRRRVPALARPHAELKSRPLFVKQRLPVCRHRSGRSGCRLIQWMTVRGVKLRAGDELLLTIVVKPMLVRLEARDYRVPCVGVMLRCMLIW
jgi:hypothetical protein